MFRILTKLAACVARPFAYRVYVAGGTHGGSVHYAWRFQEALSWAACYPQHQRRAVYITRSATRSFARVV
jgi:hypothetical protein